MKAFLTDEPVLLEPWAVPAREDLGDNGIMATGPSRIHSATVAKPTGWVISWPAEVTDKQYFDFSDLEFSGETSSTVPEVVVPPQKPVLQSYSKLLDMWEGYVTSVCESEFVARLVPIDGSGAEQEAEFDIAAVSEYDRDLISVGAVFYWSISYNHSITGQITTTSDLRFRRRPVWTKRELEKSSAKAAEYAALLGL